VWSNERVRTFKEDLQSSACLLYVHCSYYKTRNKKGGVIDFLAKNMKSVLLKLRKNRQSQRSVLERAQKSCSIQENWAFIEETNLV
jgi:hypothetical protein